MFNLKKCSNLKLFKHKNCSIFFKKIIFNFFSKYKTIQNLKMFMFWKHLKNSFIKNIRFFKKILVTENKQKKQEKREEKKEKRFVPELMGRSRAYLTWSLGCAGPPNEPTRSGYSTSVSTAALTNMHSRRTLHEHEP
jgi:hypothetical protein